MYNQEKVGILNDLTFSIFYNSFTEFVRFFVVRLFKFIKNGVGQKCYMCLFFHRIFICRKWLRTKFNA